MNRPASANDRPAASAADRSRAGAIGLALVLVVGLGLRLHAVTAELWPDSLVYAQNAFNIAQGRFDLRDDSWFAHRFPVFIPVALSYAFLGVGTLSTYLWPILLSAAELALTIWLGVRWFGFGTGVAAGAILAFFPLDVMQAGFLLPDGPMAALLTASAALWILTKAASGNRSRVLLFLSGLCIAAATVTRTYAALLAVFFIGDTIARHRRRSDLLWAAFGALALSLPLAALYQMEAGDALYPLRVVAAAYGSVLAPEPAALIYYPSHFWHPEADLGLYPWVFAAAILFSLLRPERRRLLLLLWAIPFILYLEFGTMSLSTFAPVFKRARFLTVIGPPLSLLAASALAETLGSVRRRGPRTLRRTLLISALGVFALAVSGDSLFVLHRNRVRRSAAGGQKEAAVTLLRVRPEAPIVVGDWLTACRLAYYFGFEEGSDFYHGADDGTRMGHPGDFGDSRIHYLAWYQRTEDVPAGFIVLDEAAPASVRSADAAVPDGSNRAGEIPAYGSHPPDSWKLVRRLGSWRLFLNQPGPSPSPDGHRPESLRSEG
jgi:hypothetical protein